MKNRFLYILPLLLSILFISSLSFAGSNDDCLACHSDSTLTMQKDGKTISLYVSGHVFDSSVHGDAGVGCTDCHQGFSADDVPHKQTTPNVDCSQCHDVKLHAPSGAKYQMAHSSEKCWDCHGTHDIESARKINVDRKCLSCHSAEKSFLTSAHSKQVIDHKGFTCETCHQKAHDVRQVAVFRGTGADTLCSQCHKGVESDIENGIHKKAFSDGALRCVTCHTAHEARISKQEISTRACFKCHTDRKLFDGVNTSDGEELTTLVQSYSHSIHAESLKSTGKGATCVDCHGSHTIKPASDPTSPVNRENVVSTCGRCHADVEKSYLNSSHGKAFESGIAVAPVCTDCHKEHSIESVDNPNSPVSRAREPEICLNCHVKNKEVLKLTGVSAAFLMSIRSSVHIRSLESGNLKAATCSDCHGAHDMLPAGNSKSKVFRENIPSTCGAAGCHRNVYEKYASGVHGTALAKGNKNVPVCTDCHGDHQILAPSNPRSTVYATNVAQSCAKCHASVRLTERYGLPPDKVVSYMDSYHGLAVREGSTIAANCASCHGAHEILPSSDPRSSINGANLQKTCGKCHNGASVRFASTPVHVLTGSKGEPILYWLSEIYIFLIIGIIGLMLLHNVLDFVKKSRKKLTQRRTGVHPAEASARLYVRMTGNERLQHLVLLLSFLTLVLTGFMLKFPDAWWVKTMRDIVGNGFADLRGVIHRIAGSVMIAGAVYHIFYVSFTKRGRQFIKDMLPKIQDLRDAVTALKYNIGLSKDGPRFPRFSYIEKAEYWALIWGTGVMAITGLLLWFNNLSLGVITKLGLDVATLIHYYEAILASLAILVWHFYSVIFNPEVYPLNLACIKGTLSEEEMEEEHPLELERLKEAGESEIVIENGNDNPTPGQRKQ